MPKRFYKWKLLFDENMAERQLFPRLNSRFDVKHIRDDFHLTGIKDPDVYELARKNNRLVVTFNGDDFRRLVTQSSETGVIDLSTNLRTDQIDTKLTALLIRSSKNTLLGHLTVLTGETVF
jgi:predicted nuclease of predicted toxin-antitoxin system